MNSKGKRGDCIYNRRWELDEVKKKKKRIDTEIKSLNDTADELCTKAEATAKLTFVTQANALRRSAKDKTNKQQTTNFIENWKITNYITFPPANSL